MTSETDDLPIVTQLKMVGSPQELAGVLLRVSDAILLSHGLLLAETCRDLGFHAGVELIDARLVVLTAVRDQHGLLPARVANDAEQYRTVLSRYRAGGAL